MFYALTAPWWVPYNILESDSPQQMSFSAAPYADDYEGYIRREAPSGAKEWAGRFSVDTANNFDGVNTMTGRLRLDSVFRLGIDTEWGNLTERSHSSVDSLNRGDFNLVVRFAQSPRVQFHSGIGMNWLADRHISEYGYNFTYGVDVFPVKPVIASSTIDLGTVGKASLVHFRSTIGLMVRPRMELYTGYDLLQLGGTRIHSLLTGFEFWF